jgi:hypothetical protein
MRPARSGLLAPALLLTSLALAGARSGDFVAGWAQFVF